jgi:hypothetical protein
MKDFSPEWRALINDFVPGGSVSIKVNDDTSHCFQTRKGLRQGDPLSPMLFNIVADMLALIERAKFDGQIEGVISHLVDGVVYQFFNMPTIQSLFMDHDLEKAHNLKLILAAFGQL